MSSNMWIKSSVAIIIAARPLPQYGQPPIPPIADCSRNTSPLSSVRSAAYTDGKRHCPSVMQVQAELVDSWPAVLDFSQESLHTVWQVPADRIGDAHARDLDARLAPDLVLVVQQPQMLLLAELAQPVRAERAQQANARF